MLLQVSIASSDKMVLIERHSTHDLNSVELCCIFILQSNFWTFVYKIEGELNHYQLTNTDRPVSCLGRAIFGFWFEPRLGLT